MITTFPTFTTLGIEHRSEVESITSRFEPYADFSFVNLYAWCMNEQTEIALLNDNLVVRLPDYMSGDTTMCSLIGDNKLDESIDELLDLAGELVLVPQVVVGNIRNTSNYTISEDRDSDDYMYDVPALASLAGGELKKKRNKVHRFTYDLGDSVRTQSTSALDETTAEEMRTLFKEWAQGSQKSDEECAMEYMAIDRMLRNTDLLNLLFTIVRVDNKMCAFSVNELTSNNKAICHFEKALPIHDCLYAFIIHYTANELESRGIESVNWQQDLGLPGLRQAKTSYQPVGFLRKYSIVRN